MFSQGSAPRGIVHRPITLLLALAACSGGKAGAPPAEPAALSVSAGGQARAANGEPLTPTLSVQLTDAAGKAVARAAVQVTVVLGELNGTLSGTRVQATDAAGRASFPDLRVAGPAGTYHLLYSSPGLRGAQSTLDLAAGAPAGLRAVTLQQQFAPEGTAVRELPGVQVFDAVNNPVAGARVTFQLVSGGGLVSGDAMTGSDGLAFTSAWVIGAAGDHVVEVRVEGLAGNSVMFSATALPAMGMLRVAQQPPVSVRAGDVIAPAPQVQLFDAYGFPSQVAGVPVSVAIGAGPGQVAGTLTETTDASGKATFPYLAFSGGVDGVRTLVFTSVQRASVESAPVNVGTAAVVSQYSITLRYLTGATPSQAAAFESARTRIAKLVTGDVPDSFVSYAPMSECGNTPISETVDDLLIWVDLRPIDGSGGILGQAGPCLIRSTNGLPVVGIMMFDTADLQWLESIGQLDVAVLHEMLHVVGFGTVWSSLGVAAGLGSSDPVFTGAGARAAFLGFDGGASYGGVPVPLENTGGAGTRDGHWRESVFGNELMTGWLNEGTGQPVSRTTIASLGDIGYGVDLSQAQSLFGPPALRSDGVGPVLDVGQDVLRVPLREVPGL